MHLYSRQVGRGVREGGWSKNPQNCFPYSVKQPLTLKIYLLGKSHEKVWDSFECLSSLVGLTNKSFNTSRVGLGLVHDPVVDGSDDATLGTVTEVRIQKSFIFRLHWCLSLGLFHHFTDHLQGLDLLSGQDVVVVTADDGVDATVGLLRFRELSSPVPENVQDRLGLEPMIASGKIWVYQGLTSK